MRFIIFAVILFCVIAVVLALAAAYSYLDNRRDRINKHIPNNKTVHGIKESAVEAIRLLQHASSDPIFATSDEFREKANSIIKEWYEG